MICALDYIFITDSPHRISEIGRYLWKSLSLNPCSSSISKFTRTIVQLSYISKDGDSTTCLRHLMRCLNVQTQKIFFFFSSKISHISLFLLSCYQAPLKESDFIIFIPLIRCLYTLNYTVLW